MPETQLLKGKFWGLTSTRISSAAHNAGKCKTLAPARLQQWVWLINVIQESHSSVRTGPAHHKKPSGSSEMHSVRDFSPPRFSSGE
eukprot:1161093-Pelagomonas_calceolata.AAC.7